MKNIILVGGSGLIGGHLQSLLLEKEDIAVTSLVRKLKNNYTNSVPKEELFNFDDLSEYKKIGNEIPCDIFFCCLGTTIKKAKNAKNFLIVDQNYPIQFIEQLKNSSSHSLFVFISSVGADSPKGLYLNTKSSVEKALIQSGLSYIIVRPSLLLGERNEFRLAEKIAGIVMPPFFQGMKKLKLTNLCGIEKYAPIEGKKVAQAIFNCAFNFSGNKIVEGRELV